MFRFSASRIVTMVKNKHSFWNRTAMQLIRKTLSVHWFSITCHDSVSVLVPVSVPSPTLGIWGSDNVPFKYFYPRLFLTFIPDGCSFLWSMRSSNQVRWPDTKSISTGVLNIQSWRNRTIMETIRRTVGRFFSKYSAGSIASYETATYPYPMPIWSIGFFGSIPQPILSKRLSIFCGDRLLHSHNVRKLTFLTSVVNVG